jgi:hypothetical protein
LRIVGRSPIPFGPYWLKLPSESSPEIKPWNPLASFFLWLSFCACWAKLYSKKVGSPPRDHGPKTPSSSAPYRSHKDIFLHTSFF